MLTIIIEVIGIKILLRSVFILISPGSLPNQFISPGAKCRIAPVIINNAPISISQRAIVLYFHLLFELQI